VPDRGTNLIKMSAARAKVRSGYATGLEVCISGFVAGVALFLISAGAYFCISLVRDRFAASKAFSEGAGVMSDFFRMQWFDGNMTLGAIVNLGLLSLAFGTLGTVAGAIRRHTVRAESSDNFFRRKVRVPWDVVPFLVFFLYAGLARLDLLTVYVVSGIGVGYLWRFWHQRILSLVSSLDVNRYIPKPI
jgi:hypothetical protein